MSSKRSYSSEIRTRQADETRSRIVDAAKKLMMRHGFDGATIEAIANAAGVSPQTVYGVFGSKRGIVAELFDRDRFGADYRKLMAEAQATPDPRVRLQFPARFSRQIYDAERATLELLRGAGAVSPELAEMVRADEDRRRDAQRRLIVDLAAAGALRAELDIDTACDILWTLTGRDVYRMLVAECGWSPDRYQDWLAGAIARELVASAPGERPRRSPQRRKGRASR